MPCLGPGKQKRQNIVISKLNMILIYLFFKILLHFTLFPKGYYLPITSVTGMDQDPVVQRNLS